MKEQTKSLVKTAPLSRDKGKFLLSVHTSPDLELVSQKIQCESKRNGLFNIKTQETHSLQMQML